MIRRNKIIRRFIAIAACLALLTGCLGIPVMAAEPEALDGADTLMDWDDLAEAFSEGGEITLNSDVDGNNMTGPLMVSPGKEVTLNLGGYKIDRHLDPENPMYNGSVIIVYGTLTIIGDGIITGGHSSDAGGGICVRDGGTLNLYGGNVTGNVATSGGGIYCKGGHVVIDGGCVTGNRATRFSAIHVQGSDSYLVMRSGSVTGNKNESTLGEEYGTQYGSVCCEGEFSMSGGTIADNTSYGHSRNVHLGGDQVIGIGTELAEDTHVGIFAAGVPTVESPIAITDGLHGRGSAASFFIDNEEYELTETESGEAAYTWKSGSVYRVTIDPAISDFIKCQNSIAYMTEYFTAGTEIILTREEEGGSDGSILFKRYDYPTGESTVFLLNDAVVWTFAMPEADVHIGADTMRNIRVVRGSGMHGTIEADKSTAIRGEMVTLTTTTEYDYELELTAYYVNERGNRVYTDVTDAGDGIYTFHMPGGGYDEIVVDWTYTFLNAPAEGNTPTGLYIWSGIEHGTVTTVPEIPVADDANGDMFIVSRSNSPVEFRMIAHPDDGYVLRDLQILSVDPETGEPDGSAALPVEVNNIGQYIFSAATYQDYLCFRISATYVDESTYTGSPAVIRSANVSFEGKIKLMFTLSLPDDLLEDAGAYVSLEKAGKTTKTLLSEGVLVTNGRQFTLPVPIPEYADDVVLRVYTGDGKLVTLKTSSGVDYTDSGFAYSVKEYAENKQVNGTTQEMRDLAKALNDYGAAAQIYFTYGDYQGLAVSEEVQAVTEEDLADYAAVKKGYPLPGIEGASISVEFASDNSLRVSYKHDSTVTPDTYVWYLDGNRQTPKTKKNAYYLESTNIAAPNLDVPHDFLVSDSVDTYRITASPLTYVLTSIKNGTAARRNLGKALYLYNKAANAYFE